MSDKRCARAACQAGMTKASRREPERGEEQIHGERGRDERIENGRGGAVEKLSSSGNPQACFPLRSIQVGTSLVSTG